MRKRLEAFREKHCRRSGKVVAARLQAALVLLERLRDEPTLQLAAHHTKGSAGAISHETYGNRVHDRHNLTPINKNHGRRSSNLPEWGDELLAIMRDAGFEHASHDKRDDLVTRAQQVFLQPLVSIVEQEPLEARLKGRTVEATIHEVLRQAEEKGKSGDVAQYLVGAKLEQRLNQNLPVHPANKSDRKSYSDPDAKLGDFQIANAVIEVAVWLPDAKHIGQIGGILDRSDCEVWLLTRSDRVATWRNEIGGGELDLKRVVVTSVEAFVGQNITELGAFSTKGKAEQLKALFTRYNSRWVAQVGTPGIRIEAL